MSDIIPNLQSGFSRAQTQLRAHADIVSDHKVRKQESLLKARGLGADVIKFTDFLTKLPKDKNGRFFQGQFRDHGDGLIGVFYFGSESEMQKSRNPLYKSKIHKINISINADCGFCVLTEIENKKYPNHQQPRAKYTKDIGDAFKSIGNWIGLIAPGMVEVITQNISSFNPSVPAPAAP